MLTCYTFTKYYRERIQQGLDTKHPTDIWIIGMIELLKQTFGKINTEKKRAFYRSL